MKISKLCSALTYLTLLFITILCAATLSAQEAAKPGEVRVEYDRQNDLTKITLNPIVLASRKQEELQLGAFASYKGQQAGAPKEVTLLFISLSASGVNKYESAHKVTVWADEQRFPLGEAGWSKQAQGTVSIELLAAIVPYDTFSRIAHAKEVHIRLGETEIRLATNHITALRAAEGYMKP